MINLSTMTYAKDANGVPHLVADGGVAVNDDAVVQIRADVLAAAMSICFDKGWQAAATGTDPEEAAS